MRTIAKILLIIALLFVANGGAQTYVELTSGVTALNDTFSGNTLTSEIEAYYIHPNVNVGGSLAYRNVGVPYVNYNVFDANLLYRTSLFENLDNIILTGVTWNTTLNSLNPNIGIKAIYYIESPVYITINTTHVFSDISRTHIAGGIGILFNTLPGPRQPHRFY